MLIKKNVRMAALTTLLLTSLLTAGFTASAHEGHGDLAFSSMHTHISWEWLLVMAMVGILAIVVRKP